MVGDVAAELFSQPVVLLLITFTAFSLKMFWLPTTTRLQNILRRDGTSA
jgi:hypothetical protein